MRYLKLTLGILAITSAAIAVGATSSASTVRTEREANSPSGAGAAFWCGFWCGTEWIRVAPQCYNPQTCCGVGFCSLGTGINKCCYSDQTCNYDSGAEWPALPKCLNNPV